jgi:hypothetical protein
MQRFNLKKLNYEEVTGQYQVRSVSSFGKLE